MSFLMLEDFAARLNETFAVDLGDNRTSFTLVEARPLPSPAIHGMVRAPFSLLFHHASTVIFPQRIYQMENTRMGGFGIFLTAIARDRDGFLYQAVFN